MVLDTVDVETGYSEANLRVGWKKKCGSKKDKEGGPCLAPAFLILTFAILRDDCEEFKRYVFTGMGHWYNQRLTKSHTSN